MSGLREVRALLVGGAVLVVVALLVMRQWLPAGLVAVAVVTLGVRFSMDYLRPRRHPRRQPPR